MDGMDALLATVQMPSGIPVATVAINGGVNAALLAAQILAVSDGDLARKLDEMGYKLYATDGTANEISRLGTDVEIVGKLGKDNRVFQLLENGRIAEQGSHAQLLAENGAYARLYHTQNLGENHG